MFPKIQLWCQIEMEVCSSFCFFTCLDVCSMAAGEILCWLEHLTIFTDFLPTKWIFVVLSVESNIWIGSLYILLLSPAKIAIIICDLALPGPNIFWKMKWKLETRLLGYGAQPGSYGVSILDPRSDLSPPAVTISPPLNVKILCWYRFSILPN